MDKVLAEMEESIKKLEEKVAALEVKSQEQPNVEDIAFEIANRYLKSSQRRFSLHLGEYPK